jgi:hypothetical protein
MVRRQGVRRAAVVLLAAAVGACSYTPAGRELAHVEATLRALPDVEMVTVECGSTLLAGDGLCAAVTKKNGDRLRFDRVGYGAFGGSATNVVVAAAGGLETRVASCSGVTPANFHHDAAFSHHFSPTLFDLKEAVTRSREIVKEVQYWPRCPLFWELQDKRGINYRYCARPESNGDEPPRPDGCQSSDNTR